MLSRWSIRNKLLIGLGLLLAIVLGLSWSGLDGLYAYRNLVKDLRRVNELPLATELSHRVSDLRVAVADRGRQGDLFDGCVPGDECLARAEFLDKLLAARHTLDQYEEQLNQSHWDESPLGDRNEERQTVTQIRGILSELDERMAGGLLATDGWPAENHLRDLQKLVSALPEYLQENIHSIHYEVRSQYRWRIVLGWITSGGTLILLVMLGVLAYSSILRPLRLLIKVARKVAANRFDYRVPLDSRDEMGELAKAMNQMLGRFQSIHDDLDHQVRERTKQVVRSEQLASVGFLAAGVAHEISMPLRRIAACARAIQQRINHRSRDSEPQRRATLAQLQQIQEEAFRCKEITQSLLEFSRMGSAERQTADLAELVRGMIEMLKPVGRYHGKQVEFSAKTPVRAAVNIQQLRVVVLNLLCHGLDSIGARGTVAIELESQDDMLELTVRDNGRGLAASELSQVFEPCTSRRGRQATGQGLAISARIIKDHGGSITCASEGLGRGTQFRVRLPCAPNHSIDTNRTSQESHYGCQAV